MQTQGRYDGINSSLMNGYVDNILNNYYDSAKSAWKISSAKIVQIVPFKKMSYLNIKTNIINKIINKLMLRI